MITQDYLKSLLHYDPLTGVFTWKISRGGTAKAGTVAGSLDLVQGYVRIGMLRHLHRAHRLAFLYMTGEDVGVDVDHINGCRSDNRWANLRPASKALNSQNVRLPRKTAGRTSKFLGVHWSKCHGKWQARIQIDGKKKHLGVFDNEEDASRAYIEGKARLHPFSTMVPDNDNAKARAVA